MKTTITIKKTIKVEENGQYLELSFAKGICVGFNSNLPYKKSIEDWEFVIKALKRILKEI